MPPVKERTPELRKRIIDVALDVFSNEGAEGLTTRRVAGIAGTSPPSIYELFEDKSGLVRELFYEGFRRLLAAFELHSETDDPLGDLLSAADAFRSFAVTNAPLFNLMYGHPFESFRPDPAERKIGDDTRTFITNRVQRCVDNGQLLGDATDISHGLIGLFIGLATQETGGWLGSTPESKSRRWREAVAALLRGFEPIGSTRGND